MKAACLAPPFLLLVAVASVSALGIAFRSSHEALKPGLVREHAAHSAGLLQAAPASSGVTTKLASSSTTSSSSHAAEAAVYPKGDCVTECSVDPAARMAHCAADPAQGIPATKCQAVPSAGEEEVCPSLRYPDAL